MDLSYSQIQNWLDCPERFRLERVEKIPTPPTWPLVGGRAVHQATEKIDYDAWDMGPDDADVERIWRRTFDDAIDMAEDTDETGTPIEEWRSSRSHARDWWWDNGARQVANWIRSRQEKGWLLFAEDPALGIELYVDGWYGEHRLRGYIDRLMMTQEGEPFVLDLKTGAKPPVFPLQMGIYADMLRRGPMDVDVAGGAYYMTDRGDPTPMLDLSGFTPEVISRYVDGLARSLAEGDFLPHPGFLCSTCAVRPHCTVGSTLFIPPPVGRKPALKPMRRKEAE